MHACILCSHATAPADVVDGSLSLQGGVDASGVVPARHSVEQLGHALTALPQPRQNLQQAGGKIRQAGGSWLSAIGPVHVKTSKQRCIAENITDQNRGTPRTVQCPPHLLQRLWHQPPFIHRRRQHAGAPRGQVAIQRLRVCVFLRDDGVAIVEEQAAHHLQQCNVANAGDVSSGGRWGASAQPRHTCGRVCGGARWGQQESRQHAH